MNDIDMAGIYMGCVYIYIYILWEYEWHMKSGMEDDSGILIYQSMEVS